MISNLLTASTMLLLCSYIAPSAADSHIVSFTTNLYPSLTGQSSSNHSLTLKIGQFIRSPDGFMLLMQNDGNLVLYNTQVGAAKATLWESDTSNRNGQCATIKSDGNLIVYDSPENNALWSSRTCTTCHTADESEFVGKGIALYLPGETSECECSDYMCIKVKNEVTGDLTDYYAIQSGQVFETVAECPVRL
eukprot:CAMPEP_0201692188 /NCGR_PEP_ID=MMETSP0578-20130828/5164_1 /ASSEMBLY_ACC=CAM_ASM_000663 /TAXON_ID=267565 /ORGANISM="Skeletonema grethea, Strain CCMP 1804" /LENGTH=191 /DNA_ID=CAMNT_0048177533 /DNA_START=67 /DNA_END=642 /DNA_ORIENTATION=+